VEVGASETGGGGMDPHPLRIAIDVKIIAARIFIALSYEISPKRAFHLRGSFM
jgi:hypothetical protein